MFGTAANISVCAFLLNTVTVRAGNVSSQSPPNLMHLNTWSPAGADTSGGCEISKKWSLVEGIGSLETGRQETDIYFWF